MTGAMISKKIYLMTRIISCSWHRRHLLGDSYKEKSELWDNSTMAGWMVPLITLLLAKSKYLGFFYPRGKILYLGFSYPRGKILRWDTLVVEQDRETIRPQRGNITYLAKKIWSANRTRQRILPSTWLEAMVVWTGRQFAWFQFWLLFTA
jgi:hypothetical protein